MAQRRSGKGRGKKRARGKRAAGAKGGQPRQVAELGPPGPSGAAGEPAATGGASAPRRSRGGGRGRGRDADPGGAGGRGRVWTVLAAIGRRQVWLALAALAALLCVAYGNVIFDGRSLVYSNSTNPLDYRYLPQNYGSGYDPPETWKSRGLSLMANFHDPGAPLWQWEPDAEFVRKGLRAGEPPWWNPYVGMGTPEMANLTSTAAFPPYLAMLALGNTNVLRNAFELLVVLCGGWFTFLFLHRHGLAPLACLIGWEAGVAVFGTVFFGYLNGHSFEASIVHTAPSAPDPAVAIPRELQLLLDRMLKSPGSCAPRARAKWPRTCGRSRAAAFGSSAASWLVCLRRSSAESAGGSASYFRSTICLMR